MAEQTAEIIAEFDTAAWQPDRDIDSGEQIFSESDAIEAACSMLSDAGIQIGVIWHAHDTAIEYASKREYIDIGILYGSAAAALMQAMREISNTIDGFDGIECYLSALQGKHYFHVRNSKQEEA